MSDVGNEASEIETEKTENNTGVKMFLNTALCFGAVMCFLPVVSVYGRSMTFIDWFAPGGFFGENGIRHFWAVSIFVCLWAYDKHYRKAWLCKLGKTLAWLFLVNTGILILAPVGHIDFGAPDPMGLYNGWQTKGWQMAILIGSWIAMCFVCFKLAKAKDGDLPSEPEANE